MQESQKNEKHGKNDENDEEIIKRNNPYIYVYFIVYHIKYRFYHVFHILIQTFIFEKVETRLSQVFHK